MSRKSTQDLISIANPSELGSLRTVTIFHFESLEATTPRCLISLKRLFVATSYSPLTSVLIDTGRESAPPAFSSATNSSTYFRCTAFASVNSGSSDGAGVETPDPLGLETPDPLAVADPPEPEGDPPATASSLAHPATPETITRASPAAIAPRTPADRARTRPTSAHPRSPELSAPRTVARAFAHTMAEGWQNLHHKLQGLFEICG